MKQGKWLNPRVVKVKCEGGRKSRLRAEMEMEEMRGELNSRWAARPEYGNCNDTPILFSASQREAPNLEAEGADMRQLLVTVRLQVDYDSLVSNYDYVRICVVQD